MQFPTLFATAKKMRFGFSSSNETNDHFWTDLSKKSDFWLQRSEIRQSPPTTSQRDGEACEASNFLAGEKPHVSFTKTLSNKKKLYIFHNANVNVAFSFPASGPVPYIKIGLSGRRVMRRKLEAMSPFGGEKRLTRYRPAPENEGFPRVYLLAAGVTFFLRLFGEMYGHLYRSSWLLFVSCMNGSVGYFLNSRASFRDIVAFESQNSAVELYQHCQSIEVKFWDFSG